MQNLKFNDWRDGVQEQMVESYMAALEPVWPEVQAARDAGNHARAVEITRKALENGTDAALAAVHHELSIGLTQNMVRKARQILRETLQ